MVKSVDGRQVPVVQAYAFGKYLGYLKVTFDEAGNVVKSTGNPILLDSSIPQGYHIAHSFFSHFIMLQEQVLFLKKREEWPGITRKRKNNQSENGFKSQ